MPTQSLESYLQQIVDPDALQSRITFCDRVADALEGSGRVLWAFGLCDVSSRNAVAVVTQMSGSLARGTFQLYQSENWYGGAALVRQLVECEYLLFLFSENANEASQWNNCSEQDLWDYYRPARMRQRSDGRFSSDEYSAHCGFGGHPAPKAHTLLPGHVHPFGSQVWLWSDFAQHLERLWSFFDKVVDVHRLQRVQVIATAFENFPTWVQEWRNNDPCYGWIDLEKLKRDIAKR